MQQSHADAITSHTRELTDLESRFDQEKVFCFACGVGKVELAIFFYVRCDGVELYLLLLGDLVLTEFVSWGRRVVKLTLVFF